LAEAGDVIAKLRLDIADFNRGLKQAQDQMQTSTKAMSGQVAGLGQAFTSVASLAKGALAFAGVSAGITALKGLADSAINLGDSLQKASDITGITVETLSALNLAAVQNDVSLDDLSNGVRHLSVTMTEAITTAGDQRKAFANLGITVDDLKKVQGDNAKALELVARGFDTVGTASERLAAQQVILGRSSVQLTQFLKDLSAQGLSGFEAEAKRVGVVIGADFARAADQFKDSLGKMSVIGQAFMAKVLGPLIKGFNTLLEVMGLFSTKAPEKSFEDLEKAGAAVQSRVKTLEGQLQAASRPGLTMAPSFVEGLRTQLEAARTEFKDLQTQMKTKIPVETVPITGAGPSFRKELEALVLDYAVAAAKIDRQSKLLGKTFDAPAAKAKLLRETAEKLVDIPGFDLKSKEAQGFAKELQRVDQGIKDTAKAESDAKSAASEAASKAKQYAEEVKRLGDEELEIAARTAIMGISFDTSGAKLSLFQKKLEFAIKHGTGPAGESLAQLRQEFQQLTTGQVMGEMDKQLQAMTRTQSLYHDDLATGQAKIAAYGTAIDGLNIKLGEAAEAEMKRLKAEQDAESRRLRPIIEGAKIGEAVKDYALGLQQLNVEQSVFTDESQRQAQQVQLLTTLFQALVKLGLQPTDEALQGVITKLTQVKLPDMAQILAPSQRGAELFKALPLNVFDPMADSLQRMKSELDRVRDDPSIDIHSEQVVNLTARYKELSTVMRIGNIGGEAFGGFMEGFDQLITGVIQGTQTMDDAFNKLAESLILGFTRRLLQEMFRPLEDEMIKLIRNLAQLGLQGGLFGGGGGLFGGSRSGGLFGTSEIGLEDILIHGFQHGGVFSKPTLAMIGEGGSPEVVMPQHRMETWLHDAMQGIEAGGTAVTVNVINNSKNTQVTQQERRSPEGNRQIDIVVDELIAQQLTRSGSASSRAMRSVYGQGPMLTGR
jgi:hypothetical protein